MRRDLFPFTASPKRHVPGLPLGRPPEGATERPPFRAHLTEVRRAPVGGYRTPSGESPISEAEASRSERPKSFGRSACRQARCRNNGSPTTARPLLWPAIADLLGQRSLRHTEVFLGGGFADTALLRAPADYQLRPSPKGLVWPRWRPIRSFTSERPDRSRSSKKWLRAQRREQPANTRRV